MVCVSCNCRWLLKVVVGWFRLFCFFGLFKLSGLSSGSVRLSRLVWVVAVVFRLLGCADCFW